MGAYIHAGETGNLGESDSLVINDRKQSSCVHLIGCLEDRS